jgi:hypothetical protein
MINKSSLIFTQILVILSIGLSCCADTPGNAAVKITNFSFQPESITIATGSTVVWTNEDQVPHTITSDNGSFDSGQMSEGSEFEHIFTQPGNYGYHCAIHPSMTGEIIVNNSKPDPSIPRVGLMLVADGLVAPMEVISSGDGRMFIVDQIGLIKEMLANGSVIDKPFIDLRDRMVQVSPRYDERGLLGLAFHPKFVDNGLLYVLYSSPLRARAPEGWNCTNRVSEFRVSMVNPNQIDMRSERVILEIDKPQMNHNGGTISFGPDGYLYVPLG